MKKPLVAAVLVILVLSGCSGKNKELEQGLKLRTQLLSSGGCQFDVGITADYGDKLHSFGLQCQADQQGAVHFRVTKPESIAGIEGTLDGGDGALTFDGTALHFPLLADNQVTPVSAPWLLMKTLRSGYISSAGASGEFTRLSMDDSYDDDPLHLDIWLNGDNVPVKAEILYRERKILSLDVQNFRME
ncbi:MAG: hypothetical protein SO355_10405 [Candidatus Faecousia sp.]|nr:hypothetical protein [Candidatus Faecousia sp.]